MGLDARTIRSCTVQSNYFFSNLILWQILSVFAGVSDVLRRMSGSTVIRRVDAAVIYSVPDLPKIVVVPRFFVTFLICEASAFVETSMFSNIFDASAALPDDGYAKGHGTMSVTAYEGSRATVSNEKQLRETRYVLWARVGTGVGPERPLVGASSAAIADK